MAGEFFPGEVFRETGVLERLGLRFLPGFSPEAAIILDFGFSGHHRKRGALLSQKPG
jgi:hypothetical protein